jgi:hypothetical protein
MPKPPRLPTGHRQLVNHLIAGGLIQQDESGLGWVCASRSGVNFRNEVVARVRERGFSHDRERFKLVEAEYHHGKLMAAPDPKPPREPSARVREARKHRPQRPPRRPR